jgi:hypothetical protein
MAAKLVSEITSLMDSALGPVAVTSTTYTNFDVDDYVSLTVKSKAEHLRLLTKASKVDPTEVTGRPIVTVGGTNLGGYNGVN